MPYVVVLSKSLVFENNQKFDFKNLDSIDKLYANDKADLYLVDSDDFSEKELINLSEYFEKNLKPLILISSDMGKTYNIFSNSNIYSIISSRNLNELLVLIEVTINMIRKSGAIDRFMQKFFEIKEKTILSEMSVTFQDINHKILWANKFAADLVGLKPEDLRGKYCYELWHGKKEQCDFCPLAETIKSGKFSIGESFSESTQKWWLIKGYAVFDEKGKLIGIIEVSEDITKRKEIEEKLKEKESILRLILDNTNDVIYSIRVKPEFGFEYLSPSIERVVGYSPENFYNDPDLPFRIVFPEDKDKMLEYVKTGKGNSLIVRFIDKSGKVHWMEHNNIVFYNEKGEPTKIMGVGRDITERKLYEKSLSELLKEKETYLKELQHRVKNSFSIVVSLISLELNKPEVNKQTLEDLRKRIYSIASLYDLLYYTGSLSEINVMKYFQKIVDYVKSSFASDDKRMPVIILEGDNINLNIKKVTSLGLILNELLTNAIKHSFVDRNFVGKINISLKKNNKKLKMLVSDNGNPFPENVRFNEGGFGFRLINLLVDELNGIIKLENFKEGKSVEITIPIP